VIVARIAVEPWEVELRLEASFEELGETLSRFGDRDFLYLEGLTRWNEAGVRRRVFVNAHHVIMFEER